MNRKRSSSKKTNKTAGQVTIGIDIGDQWSHYCTLSDGGDVIQKIRPVLEAYCRNIYPTQFADQEMMGSIVGKIGRQP
jgi:hypothetical protein